MVFTIIHCGQRVRRCTRAAGLNLIAKVAIGTCFMTIVAWATLSSASASDASGLRVTSCEAEKGEDVVRWDGNSEEPSLLAVISFFNSAGSTTAQEFFIADGPPANQSIVTRSLLPSDVRASYKSVRCALQPLSDKGLISLPLGSHCSLDEGTSLHIDSGPIIEVRQGAVYRSGIRLDFSATYRNFFAQGVSDMTGIGVFESDGHNAARSEVLLNGPEPQTVTLGFTGLHAGPHDINFGTSDGPDQTVLGHVCYTDNLYASI